MADSKSGSAGHESQEGVAFQLFYMLRKADDEDRKEALDVYAECLTAVQNPAQRLKASPEQTEDLSKLTFEELATFKELKEKAAPKPPAGA